jgi:CMP-N-acetylneuraminic acid synthetase
MELAEIGYDSLLSVYRVQRHAWFDRGPLNYDPAQRPHPLAAQTEPIFFQDGAIFIQPRLRMIANRYFFGATPALFETPAEEVGDIDTRADYEQCTRSC